MHTYRVRWHYILCAFIAALTLIAGSLISHSGAEEISFKSIAPYALHILLAGAWFGALPAFLFIVYNRYCESNQTHGLNVTYLKQFSIIALPVMLSLAITGVIAADRMIDDHYHALVASSYGWLLNVKLGVLVVILWIACEACYKWLPLFAKTDTTAQANKGVLQLKKWVDIEFILVLLLVLLATILANTLPAKHAIVEN
ncbi:copper resistance D family protein [Nitrosomonas sp. Nm166]|uniref:copper resistance D family protein n=1 Tax=Nitrosomonas sp. Nm166 TaxID=1881054 RepID=UPI0008DEAFF1|nr:CopD family protein [Nitrosomonas sp. Nm166]SFF17564.1 putative copper resistance protein D [Nitrosomonas sp. Nm166]